MPLLEELLSKSPRSVLEKLLERSLLDGIGRRKAKKRIQEYIPIKVLFRCGIGSSLQSARRTPGSPSKKPCSSWDDSEELLIRFLAPRLRNTLSLKSQLSNYTMNELHCKLHYHPASEFPCTSPCATPIPLGPSTL